MKQQTGKLDKKEKVTAFLFILPPLIGFTVFTLISLVISCFRIFPYLESKKKAGQTETAVKETVQDVPAAQQDNTELIAVIAAAIAASTGTSTDDFVVRSIKRRY